MSADAASTRLCRACLALLGATLLLTPSQSLAAGNPIAEGRAELHLDRHLLGQLEGARAKVVPRGQSISTSSSTFVFGVTGGALDPTTGAGTFDLADGIAVKRGRRAVGIREITVETSAGFLVAKVGGKKMRLGLFKAVDSTREGFGVAVSIASIDLSGSAARRLNQALDLEGRARLHGGEPFGSMHTTTQPSEVQLLPGSGYAELALEKGESGFDKLAPRGTFYGAIRPALLYHTSFWNPGPAPWYFYFTFPAVGGWIAPDGSRGEIELPGGLTVERAYQSSPVVRLERIVVNLGTGYVDADASREPAPLPTTGRAPVLIATERPTATVDQAERKFTIHVPPTMLTANLAASLNETFLASPPPPSPESLLSAGDGLGEGLSITAVAR